MWWVRRTRGRGFSTRAKAFTLTEVMISMIIIAVVGSAVVAALFYFIATYHQLDDYTSAESEMSYAVQRLAPEFALIGLGMPNNRKGQGSFALTFRSAAAADPWPIMAFMGEENGAWGGPVTIANSNPANTYPTNPTGSISVPVLSTEATLGAPSGALGSGGAAYIGPELYYAWGVPTKIKATFEAASGHSTVANEDVMRITEFFFSCNHNPVHQAVRGGSHLNSVRFDNRDVGLLTGSASRNTRSWMLFPTLRLPMLLTDWSETALSMRVAPVPGSTLAVEGTAMGLDEIHLIQAARLYRNANNELVRVIFHGDYTTGAGIRTDVLAHNIVGLQFVYNPRTRLLTMYIAARGSELDPVGRNTRGWPAWLPQQIDANDARYRIVVKNLTWRIRN